MSALGYLRPHSSCEYLTAGRLYPLIQRGINTETFAVVDDNHSTHGFSKEWLDDHGGFDCLPPDNGLGWLKYVHENEVNKGVHVVTKIISDVRWKIENDHPESICTNSRGNFWEYIPPHAEQAEDKEVHIPMAVHSAISQIEKNEAAPPARESDDDLWIFIPLEITSVDQGVDNPNLKEFNDAFQFTGVVQGVKKNEAAERDQPGIRSYEELRKREQEKRDTEQRKKQLKEICEKHGYLVMANDAQERATKPMGMGKW